MPAIIHETVLDADPERVLRAVTTEAGLSSFWTDQASAQPREGSQAWFAFGSDAETQFRFEVTRIAPGAVEWRCTGGPEEWVGTEVRWLMHPRGSGTSLRFEHLGWASADGDLGACSMVWARILDRLARYVESGSADPYFHRAA